MSDGGGVGRIFLSRPLLKKWAIPGLFFVSFRLFSTVIRKYVNCKI